MSLSIVVLCTPQKTREIIKVTIRIFHTYSYENASSLSRVPNDP